MRRLVLLILLAAPCAAEAQSAPFTFTPRTQWEWRTDVLAGPPSAAQLGIGVNIPTDFYDRVGIVVGAGAAWDGGRARLATRVDAITRYLLDPFHEFRWGPYMGAGVTARWTDGRPWRADLLVLIGVEGPGRGSWRSAVEAGLGGGARLGIVLRRARTNGR